MWHLHSGLKSVSGASKESGVALLTTQENNYAKTVHKKVALCPHLMTCSLISGPETKTENSSKSSVSGFLKTIQHGQRKLHRFDLNSIILKYVSY